LKAEKAKIIKIIGIVYYLFDPNVDLSEIADAPRATNPGVESERHWAVY